MRHWTEGFYDDDADERLVDLARLGDERAFGAIIERYRH